MNNLSDLTKVRPSDPFRFPARVYNDLQDMLTWWRRQKTSFSGGISLAGPGQDGETILVRNDCGADRMNGEVLALNGPIFNHADNPADFEARNWIWSGNQPGSSSAGKFCLLLEPIASAAIGRAAISGTWPANVNTSTAADTNAEISANSYNLQGGSTGSAQILSTEGNPSGLQSVRGAVAAGLCERYGALCQHQWADDPGKRRHLLLPDRLSVELSRIRQRCPNRFSQRRDLCCGAAILPRKLDGLGGRLFRQRFRRRSCRRERTMQPRNAQALDGV